MVNKDNSNMISPKMADLIRTKITSHGAHKALEKDYISFLKEEPLCKNDIKRILGLYQRLMVEETFAALLHANTTIDERNLRVLSERVRKLLQFSFAAGLVYGKGKMSGPDMEASLEYTVKNQANDELDALIKDELNKADKLTKAIENLFGPGTAKEFADELDDLTDLDKEDPEEDDQ